MGLLNFHGLSILLAPASKNPSPQEREPGPEKPDLPKSNKSRGQDTHTGKSTAVKLRQQVAVNNRRNESNKISARTLAELNEQQIRNLSSMIDSSATNTKDQKEEIVQYLDKFVALHQGVTGWGHDIEIKNYTYDTVFHPDPEFPTKADSLLFARLPSSKASRLKELAQELNMFISERPGTQPVELAIDFEGSFTEPGFCSYVKDALNHTKDSLGGTVVYSKKCNEAAQIFSEFLQENPDFRIDLIAGHSAGGAKAQYFKAALESRGRLPHKKLVMIIIDPQLINERSAKKAIKNTPYGDDYDYRQPRGIAITLDNPDDPRKGLMGRMKSLGYRYAGLVELKLPVEYGDAVYIGESRYTGQPKPIKILGYHNQPEVFDKAIHRFAGCGLN